MEYIKPMFLLLFVLGIVAAVSSRHAAKHYPVEDAGNQDESSLVKKTLKRHGLSLTSAFDIGEEKNERKVSSVSNMDDYSSYVYFIVHNPENGVKWEALKPDFIKQGKRAMELPSEVSPGHPIRYHVQLVRERATGVFTYFIPEMGLTLAVMYDLNAAFEYGLYNVKIYSDSKHATQALYTEMAQDSVIADGEFHHMELGLGFTAQVEMSILENPTLTVRDMNVILRKNLNTE